MRTTPTLHEPSSTANNPLHVALPMHRGQCLACHITREHSRQAQTSLTSAMPFYAVFTPLALCNRQEKEPVWCVATHDACMPIPSPAAQHSRHYVLSRTQCSPNWDTPCHSTGWQCTQACTRACHLPAHNGTPHCCCCCEHQRGGIGRVCEHKSGQQPDG